MHFSLYASFSLHYRKMAAALFTRTSLVLIILASASWITGAVTPLLNLTAIEGQNITLSDGTEPPAGDTVYWVFEKEWVAYKSPETIEYHGMENDKLYLDANTGALTIYNVSEIDSGCYSRRDYRIVSEGNHQLNVTARQASELDPAVGETVTLYTNHSEVPQCSIITWNSTSGSSQTVAESICLYDKSEIKYSGDANLRLTLNRLNASLTISDLKLTDSGMYSFSVQANVYDKMIHLEVFAPISQPHIMNNGTSTDCLVLCTVKNGKELILFWYRGNEKLSNTSSPDLKTNLTLPLNITAQDNTTYSCMASNPVGNLTTPFNKDIICPGPSPLPAVIWWILGVLGCIIIIIVVVVIVRKKRSTCCQHQGFENVSST